MERGSPGHAGVPMNDPLDPARQSVEQPLVSSPFVKRPVGELPVSGGYVVGRSDSVSEEAGGRPAPFNRSTKKGRVGSVLTATQY
jgi:hypothetical protein